MDKYLVKVLKLVRPGGSTKDCVGSTKDRGDAMHTSIRLRKTNEQKRQEKTLGKDPKYLFMFSWMCSQGSPPRTKDQKRGKYVKSGIFPPQILSSVASAFNHVPWSASAYASRTPQPREPNDTDRPSPSGNLDLKLPNRSGKIQTGDSLNLKYHVYTSEHHRFPKLMKSPRQYSEPMQQSIMELNSEPLSGLHAHKLSSF